MITPENFADALRMMGFTKNGNRYEKDFPAFGVSLKADLKAQKLVYPEAIRGRERNDYYDEAHKENLVVFECVHRLLEKGYRPEISNWKRNGTLAMTRKADVPTSA